MTRDVAAGLWSGAARPLRVASAALPRLRLLPPAECMTMRSLSDMIRPYLWDFAASAAGFVGAVAAGYRLFAADAAGDATALHAVFLLSTAVMLLGTVRFLVRTMDFPEPVDPPANDAPRANGRARRDEADGAKE